MSDLEGDRVVHGVLPCCDLSHLFLYVFLCGSLHIDVIAVSTGIVAGDCLETRTRANTIIFVSMIPAIFFGTVLACFWHCCDTRWILYLAKALSLVHARAMDQQGVEEDGVTLLHLQVHSGVLWVIATHSVVHLVYATLQAHEIV